jgi:hemoglobin
METIYERIGGKPQVEQLVTTFYQHVLLDPLLKPFFEKTDVEKLKQMQIAFFTIALGGPEPSDMPSLVQAHQGRGIRRNHLTRFTEILVETLRSLGIQEDDINKIYARVATYSNEILSDTSVDG